MLEEILILILLCVIGLLGIASGGLLVNLKRARANAASWKLAAEHWEKEARGW